MARFSLSVIIAVGLLIRMLLLIVNHELMTLPQGGADAVRFERLAWAHAQVGGADVVNYLRSGTDVIMLVGSTVYSVTGRAPYALGVLMVLLGLSVIYLAYRAALELWEDERTARMVAWAVALFPQLVLHSVLFLREIPVSFCLAAAALCAVRYIKRNNFVYALWYVLWVGVGALFHSGVIFAIPGLALGVMLARPRGNRGKVNYYAVNAATVLLLVGMTYAANETGFGLGKFGGSLDGALEQFEQQEMAGTEGGAAFPEWMRIRGGLSDAWKLPVRYATFLFSPLVPLMVRSPRHVLGVVDAALYLFLFWNLYRNRVWIRQSRPVIILLVVLFTLCLVYALGVANFGTAIRHRAKMSPILLLLAAGLPHHQRLRLRERRATRAAAGQPVSV